MPHTNELCDIQISYIQISHITHDHTSVVGRGHATSRQAFMSNTNESCHKAMRHVTTMNESSYTHKRVMSRIAMSHVTHINTLQRLAEIIPLAAKP
mmetsp:Transcript_39016/g.62869  ORF Transcript_39016/g.62869 Transcript_39016/m.62869 type:complete len:96 (-) Transcript_39016:156-443(-)